MAQQVALITGGATGIGKETAKILAARGVKIVLTGRRADIGAAAVEELRRLGGDATFVTADVADEADVRRSVDVAVDTYGGLTMAVNNAGISNETVPLGDSDTANFEAMLRTNVLGVYHSMKYQIRQMLEQGGGAIVNLASIAGLNGIPYAGPYAATKHAVVGLTKSGALDYATRNVRVNAVAPGAIATDLIAQQIALGQYDAAAIAAMHPMARMGRPEEIARGIAWLLSDEASFVTGHVLNIDGGFQAK